MRGQTSINDMGWRLENSYAQLPPIFFSKTLPTFVSSPKLVMFNHKLAKTLGLHSGVLESDEGAAIFSGNLIPKGSCPLAQAYAGHQFGQFTMLGDGRAILLGEQITTDGKARDIQLKGAGRTPYSRMGDGRATLPSMLREYLISEAMYGLGIATTRSLAVATTGETVIRQTEEPGAILTRVAKSHLRVGTFQYVSNWGNQDELRALADYAIERHFKVGNDHENKYLYLLQQVIKRQAKTIAKWQQVGFVHGVMNTDNMTISGETIDYGPCAFMDTYNPATVFSSIDRNGRYAYGNQPPMAAWNLARFAETLLPLLHENINVAIKIGEDAITQFARLYEQYWLNGMRSKLGIFNEEHEDSGLVQELLSVMQKYKADYTNTFLALTWDQLEGQELYSSSEFSDWYGKWQERLTRQVETKVLAYQLMQNHNPAVIPRNHSVEEALGVAKDGNYDVIEHLLEVLSCPYAHLESQKAYATLPEVSQVPYQTFCGT
ncbi:MAG: YdiU family protein [Cellulosilyticaceae bacterium]